MAPVVTEGEKASLTIQFARMEGKIDQVITDHDRRLDENTSSIQTILSHVQSLSLNGATNTANISALTADVAELRATHNTDIVELKTVHNTDILELKQRTYGALGRAMQVAGPLVAFASFALAFLMWVK